MPTAVLSVRVRKELKEEAERLGIDLKEVVERALEREVKRKKMELLKKKLNEALNNMNVSEEEWIKTVKEMRKER